MNVLISLFAPDLTLPPAVLRAPQAYFDTMLFRCLRALIIATFSFDTPARRSFVMLMPRTCLRAALSTRSEDSCEH